MNGEIRLFKILVSSPAELYCEPRISYFVLIKFINIRVLRWWRSYRSISVVSGSNLLLREMGKLTEPGPWPPPVSCHLWPRRHRSSGHPWHVTPTTHILQMSITPRWRKILNWFAILCRVWRLRKMVASWSPNYLQIYFGHRLVQAAPTELNIIST